MTYYVDPPPSVNNLFFNGKKGRVKSTEYRLWQTTAGLQLNIQRAKPIAGRVDVDYAVPRNNRRDLGNFEKALSDILVKQGVITDDRKIERIAMRWQDYEPRVCIEVRPIVDGCESGAESPETRYFREVAAVVFPQAQRKTNPPAQKKRSKR